MNVNLSKVFTFLVASLLIIALPMVVFVGTGEEESGGTAGTKMFAEPGGSGEFAWNDIHNFVIEENDVKLEEEFNVTICEEIKEDKDTGDAYASGYIFGELTGIIWDDSPEPVITISNEDFEEYREVDDENNLTVYALGEYWDDTQPSEDEMDRWAWKSVTITKPNNPPNPVAWVAAEGNWTWFNLSEENDVTFVIEEGNDITLWFNADQSWDPDSEDVTDWRWDLNEDGTFGGAGEKGENISKPLTAGKSYDFGLQVGDQRGKFSDTTLDFTIRIQSPELKSDLTVGEIHYENKNNNKANYEVGDIIIVQPKIKNEGDNDTTIAFKVLIEYSTDNGASYHELTQMGINDVISSGNFKLLTYNWDTGSFADGQYKIRVTADFENVEDEDYEDNNVNTTNLISLEDKVGTGSPIISIEFATPDKSTAKVNEPVNVTVSIKNDGDGDANYVDVNFDVGGEDLYFRTIEVVPAGGNATLIFPFTGDAKGDYVLGFIAKDDGIQQGDKVTVTITVEKEGTVIIDPDPVDDGGDSSGFIPGFEIVSMIGAVVAGTVLFSLRRRR